MSNLQCRIRRLLLVGGVAATVGAAPLVGLAVIPTAAADSSCPAGETEDLYTDVCVPEMSPNVPGGNYATTSPTGGLPSVDGIPCTGANTGECIGLQESEGGGVPNVSPHSSLSSSP